MFTYIHRKSHQDGAVTDTTKHIWLQGRQCWMLARIANLYTASEIDALVAQYAHTSPARQGVDAAPRFPGSPVVQAQPLTRDALICAAERGVDWLRQHAVEVRNCGNDFFTFFLPSRL